MARVETLSVRYVPRGPILRDLRPGWQRSPSGRGCRCRRRLDFTHDLAFTMLELLVVLAIAGIVAAMAIPQAYQAVKSYRLHADATGLAGQLNVARMRAASQFAPYREVINTNSGTYWQEKLCGNTSVSVDAACSSPYNALTTAGIEGGTQYASQGDTFASCRPAILSAGTYPGTIQADPSPCPNPVVIYFNTRGMPVDSNGNPLGNGGAVIYVRNLQNLTDAVTATMGGSVIVWSWSTTSNTWVKR